MLLIIFYYPVIKLQKCHTFIIISFQNRKKALEKKGTRWFDPSEPTIELYFGLDFPTHFVPETIVAMELALRIQNALKEVEPQPDHVPLVMVCVVHVSSSQWKFNAIKQLLSDLFFLVVFGCGRTSSQNCTYFESTGGEVGQCRFRICPCSDNICQLRLDFETFVLNQPDTSESIN